MPNPQLENGFIQIATEIWEKLGRYRLSGEEWLVLNCVLRKTYGWHKKDDHISFTQFEKYTGLKRASVYRAVKKLYVKKLIGISKSANSQVNLYCFNKLISQWQPISKRANSGKSISKKANRVLAKRYTKVLAKRRNTIYKKDTITKDNIVLFLNEFNNLFERQYKPTAGRVKKLDLRLKSFSLEDILKALHNLSQSPFHRGVNDRGWSADPDFLIRNDEQIDKWLNVNMEEAKQLSKFSKEAKNANRFIGSI